MSAYSILENRKFITIRFMDSEGNVHDRPPGHPVVEVVLRYDPEHHTNLRAPATFNTIFALVDTGADQNHAPPDVIASMGWPQNATTMTHGATSAEIEGTRHLGHLFFPEAAVQVETDIFSAPLRNSPATQHFLIGMSTIQCGVLIMDFEKDVYRLYLG